MDLPIVGSVTWSHVALIAQLAVLEGLLSFDNALALAALVRTRLKNPEDQRKALTWGIWGAYIFRIFIVFVGVWLMSFEWAKAIAGLYLVWLAASELFFRKNEKKSENAEFLSLNSKQNSPGNVLKISPLWSAIVAVELMDIMFSIDSIGVALALSSEKWVLIAGAVLGIFMMRLAAQWFVRLMEYFPLLEKTAFVLVGVAGINVLLKLKNLPLGFTSLTIDHPIPEHPFLALMVSILIISMSYDYYRQKSKKRSG